MPDPQTSKASTPQRPTEYWWQRNALRRKLHLQSDAVARVLDILRTLAWVVPLTVLIWVYAEREQQRTQGNVIIPIAVTTVNPDRIVELIEPVDKNLVATLKGPQSAVENAVRQLSGAGTSAPKRITITVPSGLSAGQIAHVPASELLGRDPFFQNEGITIDDVSPATINVYVDNVEEHNLPVRAPAGLTGLDGEPIFSPSSVTVRAAASVFANNPDHRYVDAHFDAKDLAASGKHDISNVKVTWPVQDPYDTIRIDPPSVSATIVVKRHDEKQTINALPIWISAPPNFLEKNRIECPLTVTNVEVTGPPEKMAALAQNQFLALRPELDVNGNDPTDSDITRPLNFDTPEGVTVNAKTVTFRITPRAAQ